MTQRQSQVNLLRIKDFALLCRTTARTIRFYDQKGLLKPCFIDQWNKYRYYSPPQIKDYFKIKLFHTFNLPLKNIKQNLEARNKGGFLNSKLESLKQEIKERQKEVVFLTTMKNFLFGNKPAEDFLKQESIGPCLLFGKTVEKGSYEGINSVIFQLIATAKRLKIPITDKSMVFYLDPVAFKPKDTKLEIVLICKKHKLKKIPSDYFYREYKKTKAKIFNYQGPFEYITLIYHKLHEKRLSRRLKPNEVGFDIYIRGSWNEKSEYSYLTKICFPMF
jgi:DNA-binding transcriptional MerR regulator